MSSHIDWIKFGIGMAYMRKGRHEAAENQFHELLRRNHSYGYAYAQLGYLKKRIGNMDEANSYFDQSIKYFSDNELGIYQRGLMYIELGDLDKAFDSFNKVIELNPLNIDAMINMALVLGRKDDFERAGQLITEAYDKDPSRKDIFARLGWVKVKNKDWVGAFEIINKDWEAKRLSPEWQVNFAQVVGHKGEFGIAARIIDNAYTEDTSLKDGYARLGWIMSEREDWYGALDQMNRDLEVNRMTPYWNVNLAQVYGRCRKWDLAIKFIENAYSKNSNLKDGFARLGRIKVECNELKSAHELITTDHKRGRLSIRWKSYMAMIQVIFGDENGAISTVDEWYATDVNAVDGYARIGWANYLLTGKKEKLKDFLIKDRELKKYSTAGKKIGAWELSISGELALSKKHVNLLYNNNNYIYDIFAVMGWLLIEKGEYEEGLKLMDKDYNSNRISSAWKINYAYQLSRFGQYGKAQKLFNEVVKSEPHRDQFRIGFHLIPLEIIKKSNFEQMIS